MAKRSSKLNIDFGNYPMKPWINSKNNEGQIQHKVEDVARMNFFLPPKGKDDLFIIRFGNQNQTQYEITPQVKRSKLLERSWIDIKSLESSINRINSVILPFKEKLA